MTGLLDWLAGLPPAILLRQSATLYLFVNAAHILSIGIVIGAILPLDLRLAGLLGRTPIQLLAPFLVRSAATGLVLAILTGVSLFSVKPSEYIANPAFLAKLALLALAIINVVALHLTDGWRRALADGTVSASVRLLAMLSFTIWISVVIAGRWIGFA